MKKKVLGQSIDYRDIVNFNVRLSVEYRTITNEKVSREAIFQVQTTDKQTAIGIAIEKAKKQLEEFPYIIKETIIVEEKRRKRRCKNGEI